MKPEVITIGLGYIGLPTSALIASQGTKVLGVDTNQKVVDIINNGEIHIVEPELDKYVFNAVSNGFFKASTEVQMADVFLIVVPTPFKENHEPDISYVEEATRSVIPNLKKGDLFIIESTCPIGTTEKMQNLIFSLRPELKDKIFIAYCPERVLPGNIMHELIENDRVIGGVNKESTEKAVLFYSNYVKGELHTTNAKTAEMCKLVENSSRDNQIAFANELSLICDKAEINVWELIKLANKHPRVNILQPGCGVGGHCIAVDPYFIIANFPKESQFISTARKINNYKSFWCSEKIKNEKLKFELKRGRKPKVAFMGLTFKPNIDDLRESPAEKIVSEVLKNSEINNYFVVEPNIDNHSKYKLSKLNEAIFSADIIAFLVSHDQFKELAISDDKLVLDFCGVLNKWMLC